MSRKDNGVNEVNIPYSIAELGLIAAAMHSSACEAMVRTGGKKAKERYLQMADRARKICPLPLRGGREYSWFNGFSALECGKSYSVYWDRQPQTSFDGRDDESIQLALIVDGARYNLTERLEFDVKNTPISDEYMEILQATDELAKRAAPMDAERNSSVEFSLESEQPKRGFKTSESEDRRELVSQAIAERIGIDAKDRDFYITNLQRDYYAKGWKTFKINVVGPQERIDQIKAAYDLEPAPLMSI